MRVICINDKYLRPTHPKIFVGEYYNIEDIEMHEGDAFYILEEIQRLAEDGCRYNYSDERFALISNIDEKESTIQLHEEHLAGCR